MLAVTFDFSQFESAVAGIERGIEQLPFALSQAMNESVKTARRQIVEKTWPAHVTVRNARFMNAALRMEFATKNKLVVSVFDTLGRARLKQHDEGGTKLPKGGKLAIPTRTGKAFTGRGTSAQRVRVNTIPNTFRKGDAIYQRLKGGDLKLLYILKSSAKQPQDVPFTSDFHRVMAEEMRRSFPQAFAKALASRKR